MSKFYDSISDAIADIKDDSTLLVGGFGLCGVPTSIIHTVKNKGVKNLTVVSNNCGTNDHSLGLLLANKQIKKVIASYVGENKLFEQQFLNGEIEVELTPQGTLAERIRAGGAGIPAFYTATGVGTSVADGKEEKIYNGRKYILEEAITGDFAIVKAWKSDTYGNLVFRKTARNFNPLVATAGKVTIVEVEELVNPSDLDPDEIHLPGIYVQRIVLSTEKEKIIERETIRQG